MLLGVLTISIHYFISCRIALIIRDIVNFRDGSRVVRWTLSSTSDLSWKKKEDDKTTGVSETTALIIIIILISSSSISIIIVSLQVFTKKYLKIRLGINALVSLCHIILAIRRLYINFVCIFVYLYTFIFFIGDRNVLVSFCISITCRPSQSFINNLLYKQKVRACNKSYYYAISNFYRIIL